VMRTPCGQPVDMLTLYTGDETQPNWPRPEMSSEPSGSECTVKRPSLPSMRPIRTK